MKVHCSSRWHHHLRSAGPPRRARGLMYSTVAKNYRQINVRYKRSLPSLDAINVATTVSRCMSRGVTVCRGYQSTRHMVISSYGHVVTRSTRHRSTRHRRVFFHRVNSSHGQVVTPSSRHKPALYKAKGRGPKFSGHADIKGHYQCANFGSPEPQGEIAGVSVSFTQPPSKLSCQIFETIHNARSSRQMVKSSHSQLVTTPLYTTVNSSHDFRRFLGMTS